MKLVKHRLYYQKNEAKMKTSGILFSVCMAISWIFSIIEIVIDLNRSKNENQQTANALTDKSTALFAITSLAINVTIVKLIVCFF